MTDTLSTALPGARRAPWLKPLIEWAIWVALAALAWQQTALFDRTIPNYAFGATGWPRAICAAIVIGATGQLLYRLASMRRAAAARGDGAPSKPFDPAAAVKRAPIFLFPLLFLWLAPRIGFYIAAPGFILGMLLILHVRSTLTVATATAVIYGLLLLIFTRFFYVALPVGRIESFYEVNNAIIGLARWGM